MKKKTPVTHKTLPELSMRSNAGKPIWTMIWWPWVEGVVRILEFGMHKYARDNWRKGNTFNHHLDSAFRHLTALAMGEDLDPDSGLPHEDHVSCNMMFFKYNKQFYPERDDRNGKQLKLPFE